MHEEAGRTPPQGVYRQSQRRFVAYVLGLVRERMMEEAGMAKELSNLLAALRLCEEMRWQEEQWELLRMGGDVLLDYGQWREYRRLLELAVSDNNLMSAPALRELYVDLLDDYAALLEEVGEADAAEDTYKRVIELARAAGLGNALARAEFGIGGLHLGADTGGEASAHWSEAVAADQEDEGVRSAVGFFSGSDRNQLERWLTTTAETTDNPAVVGWATYAKAQFHARRLFDENRLDDAMVEYQRVRRLAERRGDRQGLAIALFHLGEIVRMTDQTDDAVELYKASARIVEEINNHTGLLSVYAGIGRAYLLMNDFARALPYLSAAVQLHRGRDSDRGLAEELHYLAYAQANAGDLAAAEASLLEAVALYSQHDPVQVSAVERTLERVRALMRSSP